MKIIHVCLAGSYNDGWSYHDNLLSVQNKLDGHDVTIITTQYINDINSDQYIKIDACEYIDDNGIKVIRLKNSKCFSERIAKKLRIYEDLYVSLEKEKPDMIFVHCCQFLDLSTITKYKRNYPGVVMYIDNHADKYNSAKRFMSKYILHKLIYKYSIRCNIKYFEKVFYIAQECGEFLKDIYGLEEKKHNLEFFTLGGYPIADEVYISYRKYIRDLHKLDVDNVVFLHTGKMERDKKTLELLSMFDKCHSKNMFLFIAGRFASDIKDECLDIIKHNKNIVFLDWLNKSDLIRYMCGCDVLIQPAGRSATYQQAICCRMPVILENLPNNRFLVSNNNGFLINDIEGVKYIFEILQERPEILDSLRDKAKGFAEKELDYKIIAKRTYNI